LASTTLSRLAVQAAIAGMFLTGIGVAFLKGYEGYIRVHEEPAPASPAAIAVPAPAAVSPAASLEHPDAYEASAGSVSHQAPRAVYSKVERVMVRTATPAVSSAPTWRTWTPHTFRVLVSPQYPAMRTRIPAAQRNAFVPASYTPPMWQGPSRAAPYGYAPSGFSPASSAMPPRRLGNRPKGCGVGFG
jgi:hypothetical protein